MHNLKKT
jgi:hypothetical protein